MLFFIVIILFWCLDVVEYYFVFVNYLFWVMLLYLGDVIYFYNCFDILVVDFVIILIMCVQEIMVCIVCMIIVIFDDLLYVLQI